MVKITKEPQNEYLCFYIGNKALTIDDVNQTVFDFLPFTQAGKEIANSLDIDFDNEFREYSIDALKKGRIKVREIS